MRPVLPTTLILLLAVGLGEAHDHDAALQLSERQEILPLDELLRRAGLGPEMRILEIESGLEHGQRLYEVEYLDRGGRIHEVLIDAHSGAVVTEEAH